MQSMTLIMFRWESLCKTTHSSGTSLPGNDFIVTIWFGSCLKHAVMIVVSKCTDLFNTLYLSIPPKVYNYNGKE